VSRPVDVHGTCGTCGASAAEVCRKPDDRGRCSAEAEEFAGGPCGVCGRAWELGHECRLGLTVEPSGPWAAYAAGDMPTPRISDADPATVAAAIAEPAPAPMKVRDLIARLQQFEQEARLEIVVKTGPRMVRVVEVCAIEQSRAAGKPRPVEINLGPAESGEYVDVAPIDIPATFAGMRAAEAERSAEAIVRRRTRAVELAAHLWGNCRPLGTHLELAERFDRWLAAGKDWEHRGALLSIAIYETSSADHPVDVIAVAQRLEDFVLRSPEVQS
jgi:hypothetical protein